MYERMTSKKTRYFCVPEQYSVGDGTLHRFDLVQSYLISLGLLHEAAVYAQRHQPANVEVFFHTVDVLSNAVAG